MSDIKALEDLRVYANDWRNGLGGYPSDVETLADRIESEISERYMELPVDADGAPIKLGDVLGFRGLKVKCAAVSQERVYYWNDFGYWTWENADECRHDKPRTVEDVLLDLVNDTARQGHQIGLTGHEIVMKYADEIRELMVVGE